MKISANGGVYKTDWRNCTAKFTGEWRDDRDRDRDRRGGGNVGEVDWRIVELREKYFCLKKTKKQKKSFQLVNLFIYVIAPLFMSELQSFPIIYRKKHYTSVDSSKKLVKMIYIFGTIA